MEDFSLSQVVDKPTRGENILDLILTNNSGAVSNCKTQVIQPMSDHHLVSVEFLFPDKGEKEETIPCVNTKKYPISTFNFKLADHDKMIEELEKSRLSSLISPAMDRNQMENTLRTAVEEAAIRAKVPRYNTKIKRRSKLPALQKAIDERYKLNQQLSTLEHKTNKKAKEDKLQRLKDINEEIFQIQVEETEKEDTKAVKGEVCSQLWGWFL